MSLGDWYRGRKLSAANLQESVTAIRELQSMLHAVVAGLEDFPLPPLIFTARLISESSGDYDIKEVKADGSDMEGGFDSSDNGLTAREWQGRSGLPADSSTGLLVTVFPIIDDDGNLAFRFLITAESGGTRKDVTYSGEHVDLADSNTWDVTSQSSNRGLKMTVSTGSRYDDAGDETLYEYHRDLTFDATGRLVAMSAETKVTIDAPEACS